MSFFRFSFIQCHFTDSSHLQKRNLLYFCFVLLLLKSAYSSCYATSYNDTGLLLYYLHSGEAHSLPSTRVLYSF